MADDELMIGRYRLVMTCGACPEQYDVFLNDTQVGYLRLRHNHFRAHAPDYDGEVVYAAVPNGDGLFEDDERLGYLRAAVEAIDTHRLKTILAKQRTYWSGYEE